MRLNDGHWRKFSDVNFDGVTFEFVLGDIVIVDIRAQDSSEIEVAFHEGLSGMVFAFSDFLRTLGEGRELASQELEEGDA